MTGVAKMAVIRDSQAEVISARGSAKWKLRGISVGNGFVICEVGEIARFLDRPL